MTEFELQQMIATARAEFDLGTALFVVLSLAVIALAMWARTSWDPGTRRLVSFTYTLTAVFIFLRVLASIVRFSKLMAMLAKTGASFEIMNLAVQLPTLALRGAIFVLFIWLTLRIIRRQAA